VTVPEDVSVWNMVLDGHCGSVPEFGRSSLKRWEASVHKAVEELAATLDRIYIAAHSMGALLTVQESLKDEVVLTRSVKYLNKHSKMTVKTLADSGHYHYGPGDTKYIIKESAEFVDKMEY